MNGKNENIGYVTDSTTCNLTDKEEEEITKEFEERWN